MKFYFCEACGKRLTEDQITAGDARDKKLKGVYCQGCSIGVTTMDTLPMSEEQAKEIVKEADGAKPQSGRAEVTESGRRARKRTSANRIRPASRKDIRDSGRAHPRPGGSKGVLIAGGSSVAVCLIALIAWLMTSREKPAAQVAKKPSKSKRDKRELAVKTPIPDVSKIELTGDLPEKVAPRVPSPADEPVDGSTKLEAEAANAAETEPEKTGPPAREPGKADPAAEAKAAAERAKVAAEKARAAAEKAEQAARALEGVVAAALEKIRDAGPGEAKQLVDGTTPGDPPAPPAAGVKSLANAIALTQSNEKARLAALEGAVGKMARKLPTTSGVKSGRILKVEDGRLFLQPEYMINNQLKKRPPFPVPLDTLTPRAWMQFFKEKEPATPDEWIARALEQLVAKESEAALKTIANIKAHPLEAPLRHQADIQIMGQQDAAAKKHWDQKVAPWSTKQLEEETAPEAQAVVKAFREVHGKTRFAKSKAKEMETLDEAALKALGTPKRLVFDLGDNVTLELVRIPAGKFMMGSPTDEEGRRGDEKLHEVTISKPFYMGKYEMTKAQYQRYSRETYSPVSNDNKSPHKGMYYYDAFTCAKKLSAKFKKRFRLPTEAEWEYACRAGTDTRYYSGDTEADLARVGWYEANKKGNPKYRVGLKEPNAFGLYDMHGNVAEWVADAHHDYPDGPVTDPYVQRRRPMPTLFRGGGIADKRKSTAVSDPEECRSAFRGTGAGIGGGGVAIGFRIVLEADK